MAFYPILFVLEWSRGVLRVGRFPEDIASGVVLNGKLWASPVCAVGNGNLSLSLACNCTRRGSGAEPRTHYIQNGYVMHLARSAIVTI